MRHLVFGLMLLAACAALADDLSEFIKQIPESWDTLDEKMLNAQIEAAVAGKEAWPYSPLMLTLNLFGADLDAQSLVLKEVKNRAESADATKIVYIRDRFLDDSVRGSWLELELQRHPDRTWRVKTARIAYRCYRSSNQESFLGRLCP